ncbi:hypothetical protein ABFG93_08050 [Pseudalkalibacillus hwajinpoensis]
MLYSKLYLEAWDEEEWDEQFKELDLEAIVTVEIAETGVIK